MGRQFKKNFSILLALLIGGSSIVFVLKGETINYSPGASGGGSWLSSLSIVPQTPSAKPASTSTSNLIANEATTTTDIVARTLLSNYALLQSSDLSTTTLSDADAGRVAQTAIDKIKLPQAVQFTTTDITISNDNSPTALIAYVKTVGSLVQGFASAQTKNDIQVSFVVPGTESDAKREADVSQNIAHYTKLIHGLLATKTPSSLAPLHLSIVQDYADIQATIQPMSQIFTDQFLGLAALAQYRAKISDLSLLISELASTNISTQ
jgi:hypothetical protein